MCFRISGPEHVATVVRMPAPSDLNSVSTGKGTPSSSAFTGSDEDEENPTDFLALTLLDAQKQHLSVSARALPPGDQPVQVLHFILTSLGYADDTYGLAAGGTPLTPLLQRTEEWLQDTGQGPVSRY